LFWLVIPAQAGIHSDFAFAPGIKGNGNSKVDPGLRRDDEQETNRVAIHRSALIAF
jgi:hypothetical protein